MCCLKGGAKALDIFTSLSILVGIGDDEAEDDVEEIEALDPRLELDADGWEDDDDGDADDVFLTLEVFIGSPSGCAKACCFFWKRR